MASSVKHMGHKSQAVNEYYCVQAAVIHRVDFHGRLNAALLRYGVFHNSDVTLILHVLVLGATLVFQYSGYPVARQHRW